MIDFVTFDQIEMPDIEIATVKELSSQAQAADAKADDVSVEMAESETANPRAKSHWANLLSSIGGAFSELERDAIVQRDNAGLDR